MECGLITAMFGLEGHIAALLFWAFGSSYSLRRKKAAGAGFCRRILVAILVQKQATTGLSGSHGAADISPEAGPKGWGCVAASTCACDVQLRQPAEAFGMMKALCVVLLNEVEVGQALEFPSSPIVLPKGPAKSKVMLRFLDVRGLMLNGGSSRQLE
eukprot:4193110-Amphidinium_carterae.1